LPTPSSPSFQASNTQDAEPSSSYKELQDKGMPAFEVQGLDIKDTSDVGEPASVINQEQNQRQDDEEDDEDDERGDDDDISLEDGESDFGDGGSTQGTSASVQPEIPLNPENAAPLEQIREEVLRDANQKNKTISVQVASGGPTTHDDNDNDDDSDHDDIRHTVKSDVPRDDVGDSDKGSSSPKSDVSMAGMNDEGDEAAVSALHSQPALGRTKLRSWAPFSSLPLTNPSDLFSEDELHQQFPLPAIYCRPAARPTNPEHPDSEERVRNRLLGGPSMLTTMRREREAAAGNDNGDDGDPPPGTGNPSSRSGRGGDGGGDDGDSPPAPFDPSSGGGATHSVQPSSSDDSLTMDGIETASSSKKNSYNRTDSSSYSNNDRETEKDQAKPEDQKDEDSNRRSNYDYDNIGGNFRDNFRDIRSDIRSDSSSDSSSDGDPPAQPGISNVAHATMSTPSADHTTAAIDTVMTEDDKDTEMTGLPGSHVEYTANIDHNAQQASAFTRNKIQRLIAPTHEPDEKNVGATPSLPSVESVEGAVTEAMMQAADDLWVQQSRIISDPPLVFEPEQDIEDDWDDIYANTSQEDPLHTAQPSIIVQAPPIAPLTGCNADSNTSWGGDYGYVPQVEQDDAISPQELARMAAEKKKEDWEQA
jgi:hypothetical protein